MFMADESGGQSKDVLILLIQLHTVVLACSGTRSAQSIDRLHNDASDGLLDNNTHSLQQLQHSQ
jgi:hypothetical protein